MMKRLKAVHCALAMLTFVLAGASAAQAQIRRVDGPRQSIGLNVGYFALQGLESRTDGDVLVADLFDVEPLLFEINDFNGATIGGEWLFGLNDYLEGGVGVGFYQRTVHSIYDNVVNANGSEIEQDLKLRVVPFSATVRFLPIGRGSVEPYVGAGIGIFNWKYSEIGEFVDTADGAIFPARYIDSGTSVGPVILGGVRFPVGDAWSVGGELRYQRASGKGLLDQEFLDDKIDLGGWSTNFTFHIRF